MKHDEKWGWELVRASIGLMAVSCLLMYVSFTPEMLGSNKIFYYVILISLIVIEVALVYILARRILPLNRGISKRKRKKPETLVASDIF